MNAQFSETLNFSWKDLHIVYVLVGMGIIPLEFKEKESAEALGLTGYEKFDIGTQPYFAKSISFFFFSVANSVVSCLYFSFSLTLCHCVESHSLTVNEETMSIFDSLYVFFLNINCSHSRTLFLSQISTMVTSSPAKTSTSR